MNGLFKINFKGTASNGFGATFNLCCRVGRTARLGERGDSLLFLQPVEMDYLQHLEKHGVSRTSQSVG